MLPLDLETVLFTKPARHVLVQFPIGLWISGVISMGSHGATR
jgi:hypothetical protein